MGWIPAELLLFVDSKNPSTARAEVKMNAVNLSLNSNNSFCATHSVCNSGRFPVDIEQEVAEIALKSSLLYFEESQRYKTACGNITIFFQLWIWWSHTAPFQLERNLGIWLLEISFTNHRQLLEEEEERELLFLVGERRSASLNSCLSVLTPRLSVMHWICWWNMTLVLCLWLVLLEQTQTHSWGLSTALILQGKLINYCVAS